MKVIAVILCFFILSWKANAQPSVKRIDSIVKLIESKKQVSAKTVCDTSKLSYADLTTIECVKFYFVKDKLLKAIYSFDFYRNDSLLNNYATRYDIYYYNDGLLIKVISKDFDQSPVKNLAFYLDEKGLKKYFSLSKGIKNYDRYDGINYFIETGYTLLNEFKLLNQKAPK